MLTRARLLLARLAGVPTDTGRWRARLDGSARAAADPRLELLAARLRDAGVDQAEVADAIVGALEQASAARPAGRRSWALATALGASLAAIAAAVGLASIFHLLRPFTTPGLHLLPLLALPVGAWVAKAERARAKDEARAVALQLAIALLRAGVADRAALAAASWLGGQSEVDADALAISVVGEARDASEGTLARAVRLSLGSDTLAPAASSLRGAVGPAVMAAWVVLSFWALYFYAIGAHLGGEGRLP